MPTYDARCKNCMNEFEEFRHWSAPVGPCPECKSESTFTVWKSVSILDKAKDPYDHINGPIPSPKKVKSFANDRRKGGKDTT